MSDPHVASLLPPEGAANGFGRPGAVGGSARIGFVGLGMMGRPMVANLLKAGFEVTGFDTNPEAAAFDSPSFTAAASLGRLAPSCSVVVLMLPDSRIVDALLWDEPERLAHRLARGTLLIDMGSSDPVHTRDNAAKLAALGVAFVDAPVSGGVRRAIDGSLSIMIGGEPPAVARAREVLQALGKTLTHVGSSGSGHAVKALNNYVSAAGLLAVCEALTAASRFGIDPHLVNQVFNTSTGKNNTTDVKVENFMLSGRFDSGFALALMRKDLQTAQRFIEGTGAPDAFASECLANWVAAEKGLQAGADHTAMFRYVQSRA